MASETTPDPSAVPEEPEGGSEIYDLEPEEEVRASAVPRTGTAVRTAVAAEPEEQGDTPPASTAMARRADAPFTDGLGGLRLATILAGVLVLLALIVGGVRAGDTDLSRLMLALGRALLSMATGGAIGTLAVIAAARCVGTRVAEPELFALRMLAAAAAFSLLFAIGTPIPSRVDDWLLGVAGYAAVVWVLFRLPPKETGLVLLWHGGLIGLLWLQGWMTRELAARPVPGSPSSAVEPE